MQNTVDEKPEENTMKNICAVKYHTKNGNLEIYEGIDMKSGAYKTQIKSCVHIEGDLLITNEIIEGPHKGELIRTRWQMDDKHRKGKPRFR